MEAKAHPGLYRHRRRRRITQPQVFSFQCKIGSSCCPPLLQKFRYAKPQEHKTPSWAERRQLVLACTVAQLFWKVATTAEKMKQFWPLFGGISAATFHISGQ
jgi:hypothetical protein